MTHASKPRLRVSRETQGAATIHSSAGTQSRGRGLLQLIPDLFFILAFLVDFIFLFNLWWHIPPTVRPGGLLGQSLDMLRAIGLMPPIGLGALIFTSIFAARRLRWRINNTSRFWKSHCPRCGSSDLQRTPRRPIERRVANMGIPVRRYICVECHWRGPRIESTLVPRS